MTRWNRWSVVSGLAIAVMSGGCGGRSATPERYVDPHPLPADTAIVDVATIGTHGGRFVLGQPGSPKTFNAPLANESSSTDVTGQLFASLVDYDYKTHTDYPLLAKSWEISDDGRTYTFHLRHGIAFSDGHPITSDDVLFSCRIYYDPVLHPSLQDLMLLDGKPFEVSAPDSYTVVMKIPRVYRLMLPVVGSIRVMPKHILERAYLAGTYASAYGTNTPPESLVTSGAWRLKSFTQEERTVLTRNPYWFRVDPKGQRLPYLDELVFLIAPDQNAAALKFQAGEVDGLDNVKNEDYKQYEEGQKRGNYTLYDVGPSLNTNMFWFNLNTVKEPKPGKKVGDPVIDPVLYSWFRRPEFRKAVSMAIDRDAIIQSVFFGDGVKNWSTATPGNTDWYTPDIVHFDYNPDEAKRLLAGMGWKDSDGDGILEDELGHPVRFTMKTNSNNNMRVAMLNLIQDDLKKIGIAMVPASVEFNTLVTNIRQDLDYESILLGLQTGVPPDSPGMGQNTWRSRGLTHYWNVKQKHPETPVEARIDALIDENIGTLDPALQKATWREVQNLVNENCFFEWLPSQIMRLPVRNTFGNVSPSNMPHRLIWNIEQIYARPARAGR